MKQRRLLRFHGLRRARPRQTWNKYNLFNIANLREPKVQAKTIFQQKWIAKAYTRGYHGEHIKERQWKRMFSRRLPSVVDMDPRYLATDDGSSLAKGRGSGLATTRSEHAKIPYMNMAFFPMERRLDIAIFRALFASSARQARQMVIHGAVKVNGKKMEFPGYLLNPGDMFQVDPEKVMTATGRPKTSEVKELAARKKRGKAPAEGEEEAEEEVEEATTKAVAEAEPLDEESAKALNINAMRVMGQRVKDILLANKTDMSGNRKVALRALAKEVRSKVSKSQKVSTTLEETKATLDRLSDAFAKLELSEEQKKEMERQEAKMRESEATITKRELALIKEKRTEAGNVYDPGKPYLTPWQPRQYMAPFAFIPRYLEVNQKICAAVYLRHPVARKGEAEVPTPFSNAMNQLAFAWYLRRG
ncbi:mitochondrial 37S ribosomal protein nam9 [Podospora aff. communis PSN243]|uniref:Small ribosomal subunit protein uS4m n=1 Tax=Podospora aff. communis PSN243 TaxID=3040156 RepID=A0AAV9H2Y2_9PEZI|nr:mitochondrial 37S ribosomal protein nam9 [Podospora aff. communis PSN243]